MRTNSLPVGTLHTNELQALIVKASFKLRYGHKLTVGDNKYWRMLLSQATNELATR